MSERSLYCPHVGERFTIRGHCDLCWPELHDEDKRLARFYDKMTDEFTTQTGKQVMDDWHVFERFVDEQIAKGIVPQGIFPIHAKFFPRPSEVEKP